MWQLSRMLKACFKIFYFDEQIPQQEQCPRNFFDVFIVDLGQSAVHGVEKRKVKYELTLFKLLFLFLTKFMEY